MILNLFNIADLHHLHLLQQITIDEHIQHATLQYCHMDYQTGDEILILIDNSLTVQDCEIGPFLITQVHANETLTSQYT